MSPYKNRQYFCLFIHTYSGIFNIKIHIGYNRLNSSNHGDSGQGTNVVNCRALVTLPRARGNFHRKENLFMSIDRDDIVKVSRLAKIHLNEADIPELTQRINRILSMVDDMQSIDTTGIEPMANPMDAIQHLRDDVVTEKNQREQLMENAPVSEDGLFLVPQVLD